MPEDLVPLYMAASRLEFGDDDFVRHRTTEEYLLEIIPKENLPEGTAQDYRRMSWRHSWPELDRAAQQMIALKLAGKIKIYARRCDDPSGELVETDDGLWRLNDWNIGIEPNVLPAHPIYRSYSQGHYGPSSAKWYDPHVSWSEVEPLVGNRKKPASFWEKRQVEEAMRDYAAALPTGRSPNMDEAVGHLRSLAPVTVQRARAVFTGITGKRPRGRPRKNREN